MEQRASTLSSGPFERLADAVRRLSPGAAAGIGLVLTLAAGLVDYLTGPQLGALTFYLLPVALVAWAGKKWQGVACGVVAAGLWAIAEAVDGRPYDSAWVFLWNTLTRLVVFVVVASLLHRPRPAVEAAGALCPHCGSGDTVVLRVGLVCQRCKRLSEPSPG